MEFKMISNMLYIGDPIVLNTQDYAFPSAAMANDINYENWIYSNIIQLYYNKDCKKVPFTYFYNGISNNPEIPIFQRQYLKSDSIKKLGINILDYIIMMIDDGYYFTTSINEFYNPNSNVYKKSDFNHGIMVYGYDKKESMLYVASYDKTAHFRTYEISFKKFELGFLNTNANIGCQSFKRNNTSYALDIILIKKLIIEYIYSKNSSEDFRVIQNPLKNCVFGMYVYSYINYDNLNTTLFHLIYEHKLLMSRRIKRINDILISNNITNIINKYQEVVINSKVLLNLYIKYNIKKDVLILKKINLLLLRIIDMEKILLEDLVKYI
jgi:hypothetical protein